MKVHIVLKILGKKRMEKGLIKLLLPPSALAADLHQNSYYSARAYRASNVNNDGKLCLSLLVCHAVV